MAKTIESEYMSMLVGNTTRNSKIFIEGKFIDGKYLTPKRVPRDLAEIFTELYLAEHPKTINEGPFIILYKESNPDTEKANVFLVYHATKYPNGEISIEDEPIILPCTLEELRNLTPEDKRMLFPILSALKTLYNQGDQEDLIPKNQYPSTPVNLPPNVDIPPIKRKFPLY